jgi:hypothetical protein
MSIENQIKVVSFAFLTTFLCCCGGGGSKSSNSKTSSIRSRADCVEPDNPYDDDGGHDAGFKWAEKNGGDCDGNSESFNEGCQEYHKQLNEYNECIEGNNK